MTEEKSRHSRGARREELAKRLCLLMGWEYKTSHVWGQIRKVALAEAVVISLDKLEEIINELAEHDQCKGRA